MKKNEQIEVNAYVENIVNDINALISTSSPPAWYRLYHCRAEWGQVGDWMLLRSYSTIVAAYNVETDEFFDFLRLAYGYTATSAQHISKFHEFARSVTGNMLDNGYFSPNYRWRAV
jgi:hypothetical protein